MCLFLIFGSNLDYCAVVKWYQKPLKAVKLLPISFQAAECSRFYSYMMKADDEYMMKADDEYMMKADDEYMMKADDEYLFSDCQKF